MFYEGQIITKKQHPEFANWNRINGNKLRSEPCEGGYILVAYIVPEPTEYEKAQERIAALKELLAGTDYVVLKIAEGVATKEDYASVLEIRQQWRAEINELELVVE